MALTPATEGPSYGFLGGSVFASHHVPRSVAGNVGYVLCPPLGYEAVQCYHTLHCLAQALVTAGIHAVRLDYHGTGESLGSDSDPDRVAAWCESIREAVGALRALEEVDAVGLIGLRMGALLAAEVAREVEVAALALWEPCASGQAYVREMEILASASAGTLLSGPASTGGNGRVEAAGYTIERDTVEALGRLRLDGAGVCGRPRVLLIERDDRPSKARLVEPFAAAGCPAEVERRPGYKEMMVAPAHSRVPTGTLDAIVSWAARGVKRGGAAGRSLALRHEALENGLRHAPVRLGPDGRLFGMLTEPVEAEGSRPPVLLLAGGVVPRTAVNRMYVSLAKRLAELGHIVLRIDVSGIAESPPADGARPNDAYPSSLLDDTRAAVDWLAGRGAGDDRGVALVGLCSGAYAAFQAALDDPRVTAATLINPLVFYWREGMSLDSPAVAQFLSAREHRAALLSPRRWWKLVSGKMDLRRVAKVLGARARTVAASSWAGLTMLMGTEPGGLPGDLNRLLHRGSAVAIAFSEGDPGYGALRSQAGRNLRRLESAGLKIRVFPGADHTFGPSGPREELLDWLVERASAPRRASPG